MEDYDNLKSINSDDEVDAKILCELPPNTIEDGVDLVSAENFDSDELPLNITEDNVDLVSTENIDSGNEDSVPVKTSVEEFDSKGGIHDAVQHDCFPSASTENFDSDEVDVQIFGELPLNIIEENVDLVSKKVDSGNEDTEPEKTSVEPKDSEGWVLDTVQHDYFPSASIEEKFDFPLSESKGVWFEGKPPVLIDDYLGWKKFDIPLSESKGVWFEGKPPVIIDDYVSCRKYFDSGDVDAKIFRKLPFPEVIFELRRSNSSPL